MIGDVVAGRSVAQSELDGLQNLDVQDIVNAVYTWGKRARKLQTTLWPRTASRLRSLSRTVRENTGDNPSQTAAHAGVPVRSPVRMALTQAFQRCLPANAQRRASRRYRLSLRERGPVAKRDRAGLS
jgi:hypothetical protein